MVNYTIGTVPMQQLLAWPLDLAELYSAAADDRTLLVVATSSAAGIGSPLPGIDAAGGASSNALSSGQGMRRGRVRPGRAGHRP